MRWILFLAAAVCHGAVLELALVDRPARVLVLDTAGVSRTPPGAVVVPIGRDRWFVAHGDVRLELPEGAYHVRAERGTEYVPFKASVTPGRLRISLRRWIDMRARGYASAENHLHVPASELGPMLAAEGLDFGTSLHWWNGPKLEAPPGPPVRALPFAGMQFPSSVFDAEVENAWGAVYLIGLPRPVSIPWDRGRANLAFVRAAREQGGLICYQGGWSREVLPDALLGYVDVVNVCNNNFHRYKFQPRSRYSNLLSVEGFPEYPDTPEGMMRMNTDTYYRLLNCGLRLAAGAGSATGAKSTPAGYNRAYIQTGKGAGLEQALEAWRRGRNFVTNGPMIFLTVNSRLGPGDTVELPGGGGKVTVKVTAASDQPLRSIELVLNGDVIRRTSGGTLETSLEVKEGSWIAARATAEDLFLSGEELARYHDSGGRLGGERPCRLRFAHTSPVYITVAGRNARVEKSVAEAGRMLRAFETWARQSASGQYRGEILEAAAAAARRLR